jgi:glycosyltransferase involved in cell wall biosynthesis/O-antigen/teichoic acid export membrane protein
MIDDAPSTVAQLSGSVRPGRILHVVNMGRTCGGAEQLVADLASSQRRQGHEVLILSSDLTGNGAVFADITWRQRRSAGWAARLLGQVRNVAAAATLTEVVRRWRPDVVHLHTIGLLSPGALRALAATPTVLTVHGPELFVRATERWCMPSRYFRARPAGVRTRLTWRGAAAVLGTSWVLGRVWRRALRVVDVFTAPSRHLVSVVGRDLGPVRLVPNGFDPPPRPAVPPQPGPHAGRAPARRPRRLLFVGRLEELKGPQVLVEALPAVLAGHPDLVLEVCGAGGMEADLRRLADRLGVGHRVWLLGWLTREELGRHLAEADVVVVPSLAPEAFGLACLEAFAAGTPVVASAVGGLPDLVLPGVTGLLVPPGDSAALAGAIGTLLADEPGRLRMGRQGRELAQRYTIGTHVRAIGAVYTEAIDRHGAARRGGGPVIRARAALRDSLVRNSILLLLATVELAVGGFAFWRVVTHLFGAVEVGRAGALISAATLLANLVLLGMNNAIIRFLAHWPDRARTVNSAATLVAGAGVVAAGGFVALAPAVAPTLTEVRRPWAALAFVTLTVVGAVSMFYDNVFIALRQSGYVLARNTIAVGVRLVLPAALVGLGAFGIFDAYWAALDVALLLYIVVLYRRFGMSPRPSAGLDRLATMWRYAAGNYAATAILMMPSLLMPVLVAQRVGPVHAANYYIASLIAGTLLFVPQAATRSLFAEATNDPGRLREQVRYLLVVTAAMQLPLVGGLLVSGRLVLGLFSPGYVRAYPLLVLLVLTGAVSSVSFIGSTLLIISARLRLLCLLSAAAGVLCLASVYLLAGRGVIWVGWSLLAAELLLAGCYSWIIAGVMRPAPRRRDGEPPAVGA